MEVFPPELLPSVRNYARCKLHKFAGRFCPQLAAAELELAVSEILSSGEQQGQQATSQAPSPASAAAEGSCPAAATAQQTSVDVGLQLNFKHDCMAMGCQDADCCLCVYNPTRACGRNFGKKYLVGDVLKATCGAPFKLELRTAQGTKFEDEILGLKHIEICLLDGVSYKEKGGESRVLSDEEMRSCIKFTNHRDEALLQLKSGISNYSGRKIVVKIEKGQAQLPDLQVTDSSEALLTGRKPPFRLMAHAIFEDDVASPPVHYAVSDEFVVATRRVKQANKAAVPLMDDHISKIEHIGRETVKKLQDMRGAANEVGMGLHVPEGLATITTVGQFVELVGLTEKNGQMKKVLQVVLKLSKEKWEEAAAHALTAVMPDFRKRVWYVPGHNMSLGLLYNSKYGAVQLKDQVSLLQLAPTTDPNQPIGATIKVTPEDELDPSSLASVKALKAQAVSAWWQPGHPGWGIHKDAHDVAAAGGSAAAGPTAHAAHTAKGGTSSGGGSGGGGGGGGTGSFNGKGNGNVGGAFRQANGSSMLLQQIQLQQQQQQQALLIPSSPSNGVAGRHVGVVLPAAGGSSEQQGQQGQQGDVSEHSQGSSAHGSAGRKRNLSSLNLGGASQQQQQAPAVMPRLGSCASDTPTASAAGAAQSALLQALCNGGGGTGGPGADAVRSVDAAANGSAGGRPNGLVEWQVQLQPGGAGASEVRVLNVVKQEALGQQGGSPGPMAQPGLPLLQQALQQQQQQLMLCASLPTSCADNASQQQHVQQLMLNHLQMSGGLQQQQQQLKSYTQQHQQQQQASQWQQDAAAQQQALLQQVAAALQQQQQQQQQQQVNAQQQQQQSLAQQQQAQQLLSALAGGTTSSSAGGGLGFGLLPGGQVSVASLPGGASVSMGGGGLVQVQQQGAPPPGGSGPILLTSQQVAHLTQLGLLGGVATSMGMGLMAQR